MSQPTRSPLCLPVPAAFGGSCRLLAFALIGVASGFAQVPALDTYIFSKGGMHSMDAPIDDSDSSASAYAPYSVAVRASFGAVSASTSLAGYPQPGGDIGPTSSINNCSAHSYEVIAIPFLDPSYLVRVTMHYNGGRPSATLDDGAGGGVAGVGVTVGNVQYSDATNNPGPIPRIFTVDVGPDFGAIEFDYTFGTYAAAGCPDEGHGGHPAYASASGVLRRGSFVILDGKGNAVDFAAETRSGNIRALSYPAGNSFSSFSLANNPAVATGSFGSTMQLLGGQASAATQVVAAFVAPPQDNSIKPVSDVVDLSGTNTDPVVIKVDFDPAAAQSFFGSNYFAYLTLAWVHTSTGKWKNAVLGNTGTTEPAFFNRGYNPATDFHLGYFGVDATNKYAWAVVNHNSQFAVTFPPPELAVRSVSRPSAGLIRLNCTGEPARANRIEVSTNFQSWTTLATVTAAGDGTFTYDDSAASGPQKFYRVAYP